MPLCDISHFLPLLRWFLETSISVSLTTTSITQCQSILCLYYEWEKNVLFTGILGSFLLLQINQDHPNWYNKNLFLKNIFFYVFFFTYLWVLFEKQYIYAQIYIFNIAFIDMPQLLEGQFLWNKTSVRDLRTLYQIIWEFSKDLESGIHSTSTRSKCLRVGHWLWIFTDILQESYVE